MAPHDVIDMANEISSLNGSRLGSVLEVPFWGRPERRGPLNFNAAIGEMYRAWLAGRLVRQASEECYPESWRKSVGSEVRMKRGKLPLRSRLINLKNPLWNPKTLHDANLLGGRKGPRNSFDLLDLYMVVIYEGSGGKTFTEKQKTFVSNLEKAFRALEGMKIQELVPETFGLSDDPLPGAVKIIKQTRRLLREMGLIELRLTNFGQLTGIGFKKELFSKPNSWANWIPIPLDKRVVPTYFMRKCLRTKQIVKIVKRPSELRGGKNSFGETILDSYHQGEGIDFDVREEANEVGMWAGRNHCLYSSENLLKFFSHLMLR